MLKTWVMLEMWSEWHKELFADADLCTDKVEAVLWEAELEARAVVATTAEERVRGGRKLREICTLRIQTWRLLGKIRNKWAYYFKYRE